MAKRVCLYGILTGVCIVLGYLEHFISFDFIAPGIKLGLANSVVLLLITKKDIKGAFLTNTVRILMSAVLFSSPFLLLAALISGSLIGILVKILSGKVRF